MRHSPESCPLGNPKNLDLMIQWLETLENLTAKYDIKVVGVWTDRAGHTSYAIFDAPNMEAFTQFEIDPKNIPIITLNDIEKRVITSIKETLAFFKEYKTTTK
ncbi:MAG: hypothetical protein FWD52_00145 [Candidatus Bathyarchaeota archaeon]|nr:hypothetical protein [Candidatus Termiticorpusculum sp.]